MTAHYGPANAVSPNIEFRNFRKNFGGIFRYMYSENNHKYVLESLKPLPSYSGFSKLNFPQKISFFSRFLDFT